MNWYIIFRNTRLANAAFWWYNDIEELRELGPAVYLRNPREFVLELQTGNAKPSATLHVGSLPGDVTEADLRAVFEPWVKIREVQFRKLTHLSISSVSLELVSAELRFGGSCYALVRVASPWQAVRLLCYNSREPFRIQGRKVWISFSDNGATERQKNPEERDKGFGEDTPPSHILWVSGHRPSIVPEVLARVFEGFGEIKALRISE